MGVGEPGTGRAVGRPVCPTRASPPSARRWPAARPTTLLRTSGRKSPTAVVAPGPNEALDRCGVGLHVVQVCFGGRPPARWEVVPASATFRLPWRKGGPHQTRPQQYQYQTAATAPRAAAELNFAAEGFAADRTQRANRPPAARFVKFAAYAAAPKSPRCDFTCKPWKSPWPENGGDHRCRAWRPTRVVPRTQGARPARQFAAGRTDQSPDNLKP